MHTILSQEYLIKLPIGDRDFSFVIEIIVFRLSLGLNRLFCFTFTLLCVTLMLFNVVRIKVSEQMRCCCSDIPAFSLD